MQLQITTDYALRILSFLASEERVVSSTELGERLAISQKYVLRIGNKLKANGFVNAVYGTNGGFTISRPLEDISIYDVIVALEGTIKLNRCLEPDGYCSRNATTFCVIHHFYRGIQEELEKKMKAETLATLLEKAKRI